MATYLITNHAKIRMEERNIPSPENLRLTPAGRATRKRIREACKKNGVKNQYGSNYVYFINKNNVFVCVATDVAKYTVITAFNLSDGN